MEFDITWTITAIIAVSSFFSPIVVAILNNHHHAKMRKMELTHDEKMRQLDLEQQAIIRQFDIYYSDKKTAFCDFLLAAGTFSASKQTFNNYGKLHETIDKALLFCNPVNQAALRNFLKYIDTSAFGGDCSPSSRLEYSATLTELAVSLNQELEMTKPVMERK